MSQGGPDHVTVTQAIYLLRVCLARAASEERREVIKKALVLLMNRGYVQTTDALNDEPGAPALPSPSSVLAITEKPDDSASP